MDILEQGGLMAIMDSFRMEVTNDRLQVVKNEGSCAQPFRFVGLCSVSSVLVPLSLRGLHGKHEHRPVS